MKFNNYTFNNNNNNNNNCIDNIKKTKISKFKLDNNIKLIDIPIDTNIFSCGIFIKIGSNDEKNKKIHGIAHVLEHMLFKGTKTKTSKDIDYLTDKYGGRINASTDKNYTAYYMSGNTIDSLNIIELLLDIVFNTKFKEYELINEKKVVIEELNMNSDNTSRLMIEHIFNKILKNKNFIHPVIGYKETINNIQIKDLIEFKKKYNKKKIHIIVSGLYNIKNVKNLLKKFFNCNIYKIDIPDYSYKITNQINIKKNNNINIIYFFKDIKQCNVKLCFNTINIYSKYNTALSYISTILTDGFTSQIFDLLRNKLGVSYYCNSYIWNDNISGLFIIELGLDVDNIISTITEILLLLKNFCVNCISNDELDIIKKKNETNLLFAFRYPNNYMFHYGECEINKLPYENIIDIYNKIYNVNLDDINSISKKMFTKKNFSLGIIGNLNKKTLDKLSNLLVNNDLYYK